MKPLPKPPRRRAWDPLPTTATEAYAAQAMLAGTATDIQQRTVCDWLMRESRVRDETFIEGKADATAFMQGKRSVGNAFVTLLNWKPPKGELSG